MIGQELTMRHGEEARHMVVVNLGIAARLGIGRIAILKYWTQRGDHYVNRLAAIGRQKVGHCSRDLPTAGPQLKVVVPVHAPAR
jgi:acetylornithine/succinyldiaminopimelate/putrescine aminotransferase